MTQQTHQHHEKIHTFLRHHPMGILSTVAEDGTPWGSAIYYVADDDLNFYFVTRAETFKYHNMSKQPVVSLTVADSATQTTVQLTGEVSPLPVHDYMAVIFDKLAHIKPKGDHNWVPPVNKIHEGNFMPLKLVPNKLQFADYGQPKTDPNAQYIEQIIPA